MCAPFARVFCTLAALIALSPLVRGQPADADGKPPAPLSPYFFVAGGDSGVDRLPLKQTRADVRLNGFIASVQMSQVYRNEGTRPINATYIFPGSTRAAVNGMTMTIGERRIVAKIKEKEEARQVFDAARQAGKSASLLSQKRANVFSMEVANIMPGDEVTVALTYTEILTAEDGVYEFVYPGVVGPRYGGDAEHAAGDVAWIQNPYLAEGAVDQVTYGINITMTSPLPISSLECSSHELDSVWIDRQSVQLSLKREANAGNRDFILHYRLQNDRILTGVTRFEAQGENYFLLVSEPPKRVVPEQIPARDYFFIVDVSGSMSGFPLETARHLMVNLLRSLKPSDRFNVLFFAGGSSVLSPQPLAATPENIALAEAMMNNQRGGGGTELYTALQRAFAMGGDENASRSIVLVTDGYISAEARLFKLVDEQLQRNNLFTFGIGTSVNRFLIEGLARAGRAEAFVVTSAADAAQKSQQFNKYISTPALTNIRVHAEGVELYDMEPAKVPDMLAQRPVMVIGKYRKAAGNARITLQGVGGLGEQQWSFLLEDALSSDSTLPQLWARKRLERLDVVPDENEARQRSSIVELGLQYSLLTRYTSFVAVDETVRNTAADTTNVKQPLPLPKGVSNLAVGRPMPEPELVWIGIAVLLLSCVIGRWRRYHAISA
ncbi:MAG: VWA domain-containing protein [Gammaproteobacteria bacterium]|nr:VWA domain-containing protein [Gammaproteobacteria bacterium]